MSRGVRSGAATPVFVADRPPSARVAVPVAVVNGRSASSGAAMPVYVVDDQMLASDGWRVLAGAAMPVVAVEWDESYIDLVVTEIEQPPPLPPIFEEIEVVKTRRAKMGSRSMGGHRVLPVYVVGGTL